MYFEVWMQRCSHGGPRVLPGSKLSKQDNKMDVKAIITWVREEIYGRCIPDPRIHLDTSPCLKPP